MKIWIGVLLFTAQANAGEHFLYQCLDGLEQAERFELNSSKYKGIGHQKKSTQKTETLDYDTYTLYPGRTDAYLLQGNDQRDDDLSPNRPLGLVSTRFINDNEQRIAVLTKNGIRSIDILSEKAEQALIALARPRSENDMYAHALFISAQGNQVRWNGIKNLEIEEIFGNTVDETLGLLKTLSTKHSLPFYVMDFETPANEEDIEGNEEMIRQDLIKVIKEIPSSFKAQHNYLSKFNKYQNQSLKDRFGMNAQELLQKYADWYTKALSQCATVDPQLKNKALIAKQDIALILKKKR